MENPSFKPLREYVLVRPIGLGKDRKHGSIIIPDNKRADLVPGEVVAVGDGKLLDSGTRATPDIKVGDLALFGKYSGTEVQVEGQEYLIMRENDILAKL